VARWLPQQFYYVFAYKQWKSKNQPPVVCVPSGNFGNICAGILAHLSGLPTRHFIAACNRNDTIPRFLQSGNYTPRSAVATWSNAMDVAEPSNFIRILELFQHQLPDLQQQLSSCSVSDEQTLQTIRQVQDRFGYTLDPHGAVGFFALEQYLQQHPQQAGYFLETAHPVKFPEAIKVATRLEVPVPHLLEPLLQREKVSTLLEADYSALRSYLLR
jgi:threonine synthase